MAEFVFNVDRKVLLSANVNYHYQNRRVRAKKLREMAREVAEGCGVFFERARLTVVVSPPTRRRLDPPNLAPTCKHLIDGLTDAGLWVDDDWEHLVSVTFKHSGCTSGVKGVFSFRFVIEEVDNE